MSEHCPGNDPSQYRWEKNYLKDFYGCKKGIRVLDLGCGGSKFVEEIVEEDFKHSTYVGVDIDLDVLRKYKKGSDVIDTDAKSLPLRSNYFDLVVNSGLVMETFWDEVYRVLKPGGDVCIMPGELTQKGKYGWTHKDDIPEDKFELIHTRKFEYTLHRPDDPRWPKEDKDKLIRMEAVSWFLKKKMINQASNHTGARNLQK